MYVLIEVDVIIFGSVDDLLVVLIFLRFSSVVMCLSNTVSISVLVVRVTAIRRRRGTVNVYGATLNKNANQRLHTHKCRRAL